ncbi:MAG: hypothetical protein QM804_10205 [Propionicimonas sp.]
MDISDSLAPDSQQLDAVDLLGGARTFVIERVSKGNAEQPVQVHLADFPRPWRPGKSMRRVLAACWGFDASQWVGRRVRLFCDESVCFGKERVGGTRISHLSHIPEAKTVPLLVSQGRSAIYTVEPLPDAETALPGPTPDDIAACTDKATLRSWWQASSPATRTLITARVAELEQPEPDGPLIDGQ